MTISKTLSTAIAATALVGTIGLVYAQTTDAPQTGGTPATTPQTMPSQGQRSNNPADTTMPATQGNKAAPYDSTVPAGSTTMPTSPANPTTRSSSNSSTNQAVMPSDTNTSGSSGMTTDERAPKADRN